MEDCSLSNNRFEPCSTGEQHERSPRHLSAGLIACIMLPGLLCCRITQEFVSDQRDLLLALSAVYELLPRCAGKSHLRRSLQFQDLIVATDLIRFFTAAPCTCSQMQMQRVHI